MFSLSKILALIGIIGAVLYGYRLYNRLQETRANLDQTKRAREAKREARDQRDEGTDDTVELVRDEKTGTFVPRDKTDRRT